ncbi:MAG: hypothetical protein QOH47_841 [Sphingomonadales bacterium]|jgi:broad specificity phosphatase PhoE|nr:hypothetical protein [Sphingomonadales bacterium]
MTALELATLIETRLAAIEASQPRWGTNGESWAAFHQAGRDLVEELVHEHGARYRDGGTIAAHRLALSGVTCTSTGGAVALLRSWAAKVRRASS